MTKANSGEHRAAQGPGSRIGARRRAVQIADAATLELTSRPAALIAFGSQLLHGSVGLNAAERVYAGRGVRAIRVPTIVLSVMPHYASAHDTPISARWIAAALDDLEAAHALTGLALATTGYFATADQPAAVATWLRRMPAADRPPLIVDPTLGDVELGFYTDPGLVTTIRHELLPLATGIVPNLFELAHLSGTPIAQLDSRRAIEAAARAIMGELTDWVAVTGVRLPPRPGVDSPGQPADVCELLVRRDSSSVHRQPALEITAKGLGDTFTAALIAALLDAHDVDEAIDAAAQEVRRLSHETP